MANTQELQGQARVIAEVRKMVDAWRGFPLGKAEEPYPAEPASYEPQSSQEQPVSQTTRTLLSHWFRSDPHLLRNDVAFKYWPHQRRLVETFIYLYEVRGIRRTEDLYILAGLEPITKQRDPWAKLGGQLATGSGKTKMMSLIIAWSYLNAVCESQSSLGFGRHSLIIAPGLFVRDRLCQDFLPERGASIFFSDPVIPPSLESSWDLRVYSPSTCPLSLDPTEGALIVTNYHQLLREREEPTIKQTVGKNVTGLLFEAKEPEKLESISTPLLDRFARSKGLLILNDEAHHVWDETKHAQVEAKAKAKDKGSEEEMAWIRSLRRLNGRDNQSGQLALQVDLSATLFEEAGATKKVSKSGTKTDTKFRQADLFRHTTVLYSLAEAITDGIVKKPILERVEVRNAKTNKVEDLIRQGQPNAWETYRNILVTGIERWKKVAQQFKAEGGNRKPILFILCSDKTEAREISNYLTFGQAIKEDLSHLPPTGYKDHTGDELFLHKDTVGNTRSTVIEIHIGQKEESSEAEWEKIRHSVNAIDQDEIPDPSGRTDSQGKPLMISNPYNVVISISMIKEGWDVRNVKVIVPIRPCDSRTLTEQVLGRGLRKIHPPELDDEGRASLKREELFVIEHPSFKAILDQINDIIELKNSDEIQHSPEYIGIEQKPDLQVREMHDVRLVHYEGMQQSSSDWRERFDAKTVPSLAPRIGWLEEIAETQIQTFLKEAWAHKETEGQAFVLPAAPSFYDFDQMLDLAYVLPLLKEMRTSFQYKTSVRSVMKDFLKHKVFALPVAIDFDSMIESETSFKALLGNLARPEVITKVRVALRDPIHKALTSNQPASRAQMKENNAASLGNYQAIKKSVFDDPQRSTYAKTALENDDELRVAILLDEARDVTGWLYNHRSGVGYSIGYSWQGHPSLYYPDFIVRAKLGEVFHNFIIEVKGRLDDRDKEKAKRGRAYCELLSKYDQEPWHYLMLIENDTLGRDDISRWEKKSAKEIGDLLDRHESLPLYPDGSSSTQPPLFMVFKDAAVEERYRVLAPVFKLSEVAANPEQPPAPISWARLAPELPLDETIFVAQIGDHMMEPSYPDDSWALFRRYTVGASQSPISLDRRRVVARVSKEQDPNAPDGYTIRRWLVTKRTPEGSAKEITLVPENPNFSALRFSPESNELQIFAELLKILG